MLSLMVVFVPLAVMETFLLSIILYPMVGLRGGVGSSEFGFFFLYLLFCDLIGRSWVLLVSSVLPTSTLANILAPVFNLLFSAFSGTSSTSIERW